MPLMYSHPYSLKQARWIRANLIMEANPDKRKAFLKELESAFPSSFAEILKYISKDYRVFIRDDQLWDDFGSASWNGAIWCCGRAYGKALRNDQLVKTPEGWKRIGDILVGDEVLTPQGALQEVSGVYPQGVVSLFDIKTWDGRISTCCKDHLWTGILGNKSSPTAGNNLKTITTTQLVEHLKNGERFYLPTTTGEMDIQLPSTLPIEPYALGVLLNDGELVEDNLYLSTNDQDIVKAFQVDGFIVNKWKENHGYSVDGLVSTLKGLGFQGRNSYTKSLPKEYLLANYKQRLSLLQGLMDTGGSIDKVGQIGYTAIGTQLKDDFQQLAWSLGFSCKATSREVICGGKPLLLFMITIQAKDESCIFRLPRHLSCISNKKSHGFTKIEAFAEVAPSEATCISVTGVDKLFITNNYLVTHNTWAGAPAAIEFAMQHPDCRIGLLAPTFGMGRTNMIEGASGILQLSPRGFRPKYNKSEGSLTWPNGSTAKMFSSENGDRVRGENFHYIWADEFCFFKLTGGDDDIWKMAKMALRAGKLPKYTITTSPKPIRALKDIYELSKDPKNKINFHTGTTFDNYALPQSYIDDVKRGEGTSLYNQEILGMILDENLGAIFANENILRVELDTHDQDPDEYNLRMRKLIESMDSICIGVDPNVVEDVNSDETGICVAGRRGDKGFVFKDASRRGKISEIYQTVVELYHHYRADAVVVETNNGGDFIPTAIYNIDPMVVVEKVWASRGKRARAEPIGLLYERKKIYHVGIHTELEAQMCDYNPQVHKKSPDRMDSMVWCFHFLFPASMRGLFDSEGVPEAYHQSTDDIPKLVDLYHDLVIETSGVYTLSLNDDEGFDGDIYGISLYM